MNQSPPDSAETDGLLHRVQAGDCQALEQLFAWHPAYLHRLLAASGLLEAP